MLFFIFFTKVGRFAYIYLFNELLPDFSIACSIVFVLKLYILLKPNAADYCRNMRMSAADAHEHAGGGHSFEAIKFQKGQRINTSDLENGDININDMEPDEIRVSSILVAVLF